VILTLLLSASFVSLSDDQKHTSQGSLVIRFRSETQFDPCICSVTTSIMITTADSPVIGERDT